MTETEYRFGTLADAAPDSGVALREAGCALPVGRPHGGLRLPLYPGLSTDQSQAEVVAKTLGHARSSP